MAKAKCKQVDYQMCSDCGKQFKTRTELTVHMKSKCGTVRLYKCKICEKELMNAGSLHNHMLIHKGERTFMCRFCAKLFRIGGQLKIHERSHTQEKPFVCHVCGKGFAHRQSLITHSTLHTGIKPFQCENCGNSFSCVGNLIKHRRTHADTCGQIALTTHQVKHPATKIKVRINTPVNTCLKYKKDASKVGEDLDQWQHKQVNAGEVPGGQCGVHSGGAIAQNPHPNSSGGINYNPSLTNRNCIQIGKPEIRPESPLEAKHTLIDIREDVLMGGFKEEDNNPSFANTDNDYASGAEELEECSDTEDLTQYNGDGVSEDQVKTDPEDDATGGDANSTGGDALMKLDDCSDGSQREHTSGKKMRTFKKRKKDPEDEEFLKFVRERHLDETGKAHCKYCGRAYNTIKWLFKHETEHKQLLTAGNSLSKLESDNEEVQFKLFKCSCCKMHFATRTECRDHQQTVHADILTCQQCEKLFSNPDSLKSHQNRIHKGIARKSYLYICDRCGHSFKQRAHLLLHKEGDCSPPTFPCHVCDKRFGTESARRAHLRVHEPDKKLLCKYCGKSFHWKGQLKIHERSHTGEKPYTCLYCPRSFAYRESLVTHSSLHTGIKPHECGVCGWRFSCVGNLLKHRVTHARTCGKQYDTPATDK